MKTNNTKSKIIKGYEKTESLRFSELCETKIPRSFVNDNDLVTFIGMEDVSEHAILIHQHIMEFRNIKNGLTQFRKGDVLVAKITPCFENGKGAILDQIETDVGFGSTEFHVLRAKPNNDPRYIYQHTRMSKFRAALVNEMLGSAGHRRVPLSAIENYKLPIRHNYKEQIIISDILSDVDALIAALQNLIAKKQAIKTATMQQLLTGKKRLPGFGEGKGVKQTELSEIPEDWEVKALGDISAIWRGASPRPIDNPVWFDEKSAVGWVRISDVTRSNRYLLETTQCLSTLGVQHSRYVPKGSLIMSICATVGRPIITKIDVCIHDGFVVFERLAIEQSFLYYILKSLENTWLKHGQTGSQMNLNTELINRALIALPPTQNEQQAIAEVLNDADVLIECLEQRLAKTQQLKQGMMQELLTGKTRLV